MMNGLRHLSGVVLDCYAQVWFTDRRWIGGVLLASTFVAPWYGAFGLAAVLLSLGISRLWGTVDSDDPLRLAEADRERIPGSLGLFNSLLVGLAVAHAGVVREIGPHTLAFLFGSAILTVTLLTLILFAWLSRLGRLPAMSLPFVTTQALLAFVVAPFPQRVANPSLLLHGFHTGSEFLTGYLQSFAAITFLSHVGIGLAIVIALLCWSRLAVLFASAGYLGGWCALALLPVEFGGGSAAVSLFGFNFLFAGLALGGMLIVPSRRSLLTAFLSGPACVFLSVGLMQLAGDRITPPLALVFNAVVIAVYGALTLKAKGERLPLTSDSGEGSGLCERPEDISRRTHNARLRFPHANRLALRCPFAGVRTVTQSFHGDITHRGRWCHALDFELRDASGNPAPATGSPIGDYYTFGSAVLSPANGTVVAIVDHIEDRAVGEYNFADNWGNTIVIALDGGMYVALSHLRQGSIRVVNGQRVGIGEYLGQVGNSGRSPVPHLHMQAQASPIVGSPTIPFVLTHYGLPDGDGIHYHTAGVPERKANVHNLGQPSRLAECFDDLPRKALRYRIERGSAVSFEDLSCHLNERGEFVLTDRRGGTLTGRFIDQAFYVLGYEPRGEGLLDWLWLGLSRIPAIAPVWGSDQTIHWGDTPDPFASLRTPHRWWAEFTAPLWNAPSLPIVQRFLPTAGPETIVQTEVHPDSLGRGSRTLPTRLTLTLTLGEFVTVLHGECGGKPVRIERLGRSRNVGTQHGSGTNTETELLTRSV